MQLTGTIKSVGDIQDITLATTNAHFIKRELVLSYLETYYTRSGEQKVRNNDFVFELDGETAEKFSLVPGTKVNVTFTATTRLWKGVNYETKRVYSIHLAS